MERYVGKPQKEPGRQTRDTASPIDNVRSPEPTRAHVWIRCGPQAAGYNTSRSQRLDGPASARYLRRSRYLSDQAAMLK
jgi:hypothetical protein